jgi:hypothetical protein
MNELVDRRVLAGFRCVDGTTGLSVVDPLPIDSPQLRLLQNRSGVYAVLDGPGLRALTDQLRPATPWPAAGNFEITIQDPRRRYLPRRAKIQAPQQPDVSSAPQAVVLYPSPAAPVDLSWVTLRISVVNTAVPTRALPWTVLQVLDASTVPATVLATGAADERGEALLAISGMGLQVSSKAGGTVTEKTTPATVQGWFDPAGFDRPAGWIPNPDDILANLADPSLKTGTKNVQIGPGLTLLVTISIPT